MNQEMAVFLVPLLLGVGAVLTTGGGLYFFGIKFLANARQAGAALAGGIFIFAVLQILLYGSATAFYNAQQLQTSDCELQGESAHPEARQGADPTALHRAITACMKEAGYEWVGQHRQCKDAPVATNPYCYLPTDGFDRAITSLQLSLQ
jgi:hypothetical protein